MRSPPRRLLARVAPAAGCEPTRATGDRPRLPGRTLALASARLAVRRRTWRHCPYLGSQWRSHVGLKIGAWARCVSVHDCKERRGGPGAEEGGGQNGGRRRRGPKGKKKTRQS